MEAQFPLSHLPPAARVNTCAAVSYQYAATLGFQWRGTDSDADDARAQAADAALALADTVPAQTQTAAQPASTGGSNQVVQSALFGKLFRKIIQKVASVAKTVVDDGRRGLRAAVGVFVGSTNVTITTTPISTDSQVGASGSTVQTAWGASFGSPISLAGVQVRASKSLFLSVGTMDANNHAGVKVLNHLGARICYTAETSAGKVVDGWLLPVTICPSDPNASIGGSPPAAQTVKVGDDNLNVLAQMNDVHSYMSKVAGFNVDEAEALVGTVPNLIGHLNQNRAFTPCFAFSWENDVMKFLTSLGGVAAAHADDYLVNKVESATRYVSARTVNAADHLTDDVAKLTTIAAQTAGTALAAQANAALTAVSNAAALGRAAANQAQLLAQDAGDVVGAVGTAARYVTNNDPRVNAATSLAQSTVTEIGAQVQIAQAAVQAAQTAAQTAGVATAALVTAATAQGGPLAQAIGVADADVHFVIGSTATALSLIGSGFADIQKVAAQTVGQLVGLFIGASAFGDLFEFFAAGDLLLPAADGHDSNLSSRGVATHEYGHFTLCSLLNSVSPPLFASAYDDAASQGLITGQSPSATSAVLNESFADLIASQVAGGTNYATPTTSVVSTATMAFCLANATGCIEDNKTNKNASGSQSFTDEVLRDVSLYTDAFDGQIAFGIPADVPTNGNEWSAIGANSVTVATNPGLDHMDENVGLLGNAFRPWIAHTLARGNLLSEDSVFGGLSDAMIDQNVNWCERCQVFGLHTVDDANNAVCPTAWVGPRPNVTLNGVTTPLACAFEGACPAGQTANPTSQTCEPPCPFGQRFDATLLKCVTAVIVM